MKNIQQISPGQIPGVLKLMAQTGLTAMFWGSSGIGKSVGVWDFCDQTGREVLDLRLSTIEATDLRGLTFVDKKTRKTVVFTPEHYPTHGNSCIFLDEINRGDVFTQNACLQLILDRRIGPYDVPKGTVICAAGNFAEDGQSVGKMDVAMIDRLVHYQVVPDLESFLKWAQKAKLEPSILAFLKTKPEYLYGGPDLTDLDPTSLVFPTPRSWARASQILSLNHGLTPEVKATLAGIIGDAAAQHYIAVVKELGNLPEMKVLLAMKPAEAAKHPGLQTTSSLWGVLYSLQSYCKTYEQYEKALKIFFAAEGIKDDCPRSEILALAVEVFMAEMLQLDKDNNNQRNKAFVNDPAHKEFFKKNAQIRQAFENMGAKA